MSCRLHDRIEQILDRRLRAEGFERHAALGFAREAAGEILSALSEPTREMCRAADAACVGMPGPDDYWRAMVRQAAAAVPSRVVPASGDLFTEAAS